MKYVYLVLWLWHNNYNGNASTGGPAVTVAPMPSLAVCEKVGAEVKARFDSQAPPNIPRWYVDISKTWHREPARFYCVEVDDTPLPTQKRCSP